MSIWRDNPELYERIIVEEMISRGHAKEDEDPEKIFARWEKRKDMVDIAHVAEADYWGGLIDYAKERSKTY